MSWIKKRILFAFNETPKRFLRLTQWNLNQDMYLPVPKYSLPFWVLLVLFVRILELLFLFELFEIAYYLYFKKGLKALNSNQLTLLSEIYPSINFSLVLNNPKSLVTKKLPHIIYVAFNIIKYNRTISNATMVHEMMHIYQYQNFGATYIIYALVAQKSKQGYNYGGILALAENKHLRDFNAEQQAEIIEDYFRIANGLKPQWVSSNTAIEVYEKYLKSLR